MLSKDGNQIELRSFRSGELYKHMQYSQGNEKGIYSTETFCPIKIKAKLFISSILFVLLTGSCIDNAHKLKCLMD